jgi:hypothetical protein
VRQREPDGEAVEHFLVDGVAPAVIGGGPPEPEEHVPEPTPPRGREYDQPAPEPPTAPIPALGPVVHRLPPEGEEKRKSWVARVFRRG